MAAVREVEAQSATAAPHRPVVPLFRREAIEFQRYQRQWGDVVLLQPISTRLLTWSLTMAVALVIAFLLVAQYARKETAVGYLTPSAGTAKIFAPQPGVIKAVLVTQGQDVVEEQPLLRIATSQITDAGDDVNAAVLKALRSQKATLTSQIATEEERGNSEKERLTASLGNLVTEALSLNRQIELQNQRIAIGESLVAMGATLAEKGLLSHFEQKHREEALLDDRQKLASMGQQVASLNDRINEARHSLEQLAAVTAGKTQPLRSELATTEQRIAEVTGRGAYLVRAPISGRVSLLQAHVGEAADPKQLQLEIVPAASTLQAVLLVPARGIGFVEPGQGVRIIYDAFPYQKFGTFRGHVVNVSQTILTNAEMVGPVRPQEPAYKVTVALDTTQITAGNRKVALWPDMLLKGDIVLEKRSLMTWLLGPLLSTRI